VATKEFYLEVLFQKPVDMKFRLSVVDNIRKGIGRDLNNTIAPVTTVCRDDIVNLAYTIQCVHPMYSGAIKLLSLKVKCGSSNGDLTTTNESKFVLLTDENQPGPSNEYVEVLSSLSSENGPSASIELRAQEIYEMNQDLLCLSTDMPSNSMSASVDNNSNTSRSYGGGYDSLVDSISRAAKIKLQAVAHVMLELRVINDQFLSVPDLSKYQTTPPLPLPSASSTSSSSSPSNSNGKPSGDLFNWLLQPVCVESREAKLKREASSSSSSSNGGGSRSRSNSPLPQTQSRDTLLLGTDTSVCLTRVSHLLFTAPSVQVVDSPFAVAFTPPTKCSFGDTVHLRIGIQNRLHEVAHLQVKIQSSSEFLITGSINQTIYVRLIYCFYYRFIYMIILFFFVLNQLFIICIIYPIQVMPGENTTVHVGLYPVRAGLLKIPSFVVTWLKSAAVVLDSGSESERFLFVYPSAAHAL
jgi:hypothetical protein